MKQTLQRLFTGKPSQPKAECFDSDSLVEQTGLQHIAIIMDGNRRWAKKRGLPSAAGHAKGVDTLKSIVRHLSKLKVPYVTVYAFSTENWKRSGDEVQALMGLFVEALNRELSAMHEEGVCLRFIGDLSAFSDPMKTLLQQAMETTQDNRSITLQVALNYGSRAEMLTAVKSLSQRVAEGSLQWQDIDENTLANALYTHNSPDPDLLIRTGGEYRLSNYLLWQCAYTEILVTETLWPDFGPAALEAAIETFSQRQRRFGG